MIIGLCGLAGSGKDTTADFLSKNHDFVKVALADPLKRICKDVFNFTDEQLWGPSAERNKPDQRYIHLKKGGLGSTVTDWNDELQAMNTVPSPREDEYLTPRHALQQLGTEWGRRCYKDVWVDYALRVASVLASDGFYYDVKTGLRFLTLAEAPSSWMKGKKDVAISDVRFLNEVEAIKRKGGKVVRLLRGTGLEGAAGQHQSEREMGEMPDELFDYILDNREWSLEKLETEVAVMHAELRL